MRASGPLRCSAASVAFWLPRSPSHLCLPGGGGVPGGHRRGRVSILAVRRDGCPWAFPMKSALSGSLLRDASDRRDVQDVTRLPVRAVMPRPNVVLAVPEVRGWHDRPGGPGARTIE